MNLNGVNKGSLDVTNDHVQPTKKNRTNHTASDHTSNYSTTNLSRNSLHPTVPTPSKLPINENPSLINVAGNSLDLDTIEPISSFSFADDRADIGKPYYIIAKTEYTENLDKKDYGAPEIVGSKLYSGRQIINWMGMEEIKNNRLGVPRDPMTYRPLKRVEWYLLVDGRSQADFIGTWEKKPLAELSVHSRFLSANMRENKELEALPQSTQDLFKRAHDIAFAMLILHDPKDFFETEKFGISADPKLDMPESSDKALRIIRETSRPYLTDRENLDKLIEWATSLLVQPALSYPSAKQIQSDISSKVKEAINESHTSA